MKNYEKILKIYYKKYLNRDPDPDGFKHYLSLLKNEKINENELQKIFLESLEYKIQLLTKQYDEVSKIQIKKNTRTFFVDSSNNSNFWAQLQLGVWEPETFKIFDIFLDKNYSYIDLGAWIGPTVLYGCQNAKFCYAIEPDPVAFKNLKNNIDLNSHLCARIKLSKQCITNFSGITYLNPKNKTMGDSMSSMIFEKSSISCKVEGISFDQFIIDNSIDDCNFIKMDIEGGEFTVLPTMQNFLHKEKPTIHLSLHPLWMKNPENELKKIYEIISKYNYIYDNKLKNIDKKFILDQNNHNKIFDIVVSDKMI